MPPYSPASVAAFNFTKANLLRLKVFQHLKCLQLFFKLDRKIIDKISQMQKKICLNNVPTIDPITLRNDIL